MELKMPILALTPHGGARVLVAIANALSAHGWRVTVVTSNYRATMPFAFDDNVTVKKVGPATDSKLLGLLAFMLLSPFYLADSMIVANHFLTVIPSWFARTFLRSRYVYLVQGVEDRFFLKARQAPLRALCRWTYRRGGLVAANAYLASQLQPYSQVLLTLNLGASKAFFVPPTSAAQVKRYDVVYFLRRQPIKRLDRFDSILDALTARGRSVLCISQDDELLDAYKGRVGACKPADDAALVAALDSSSLLLLTSEHEGFALPPLEAMARGLPVVMYECGGPAVYAIDDDNAYIVTDDSSATAVARILHLLDDSARYQRMAERARATAQQFRLDRAVDEFVHFLDTYAELPR